MVDLSRALAVRARSAADVVCRPFRRGSRTVHMAPERGIGFGNYLYLLFDAYRRQERGADYRALAHRIMEPWLANIPEASDKFCVRPRDLRFSDRRDPWTLKLSDRFGVDFSREELHSFVSEYLLPLTGGGEPCDDTVLVNVRRGDYYSNPYVRGTYGFDIPAYLQPALEEAAQFGDIGSLTVVSDGIDWCRVRLDGLLRGFSPNITYVPSSESPQENFRRVSSARRLIGTNSSFSYWGGYLSDVLYEDRNHVIMPWFHARLAGGPGAHQLDPHWTVVRDIPGGWDS